MASKELKVIYSGDASGLKKTLGDIDRAHATLGSKLQSVGKSLSSAGSTMTRNFTLPIVAGFAVAVNEAVEFKQVQAQTAAALKSTGGAAGVTAKHIVDLSGRIGDLSAQDGELVQAGENVMLTFTNVQNSVGKGNNIFDRASMAAANLSARMGTDLKGAMVLVGKAVNDPIKGLASLTRVGVTFTDAQKAQITAMVNNGHSMQAQKIILGELSKEFGGSAAAAGKAASPFTKLKLVALDFAQTIGTILLPFVKQAGEFVAGLADKFQALSPGVQRTVVAVLAVVAVLGPLLLVAGKMITAFGIVKDAWVALNATFLISPWGLVIAGIIALVVVVVTHFREIKDFVLKVWNAIKNATRPVWEAIATVVKTVLGVIKTVLTTYFNVYKAAFTVAWAAIKAVTTGAWDVIKTVIVHPLEFIWDHIRSLFQKVKPAWNDFWNGLKAVATGIWDGITSVVSGAVSVIKGILNVLIEGWNVMIRGFNAMPFVPNLPTIPHLASGTQNFRGGLALVGERGPELVGLPRGSSVTPAPATARAMGGGSNVIVVNFTVQGSVIAEKDLMAKVRRAAQRGAARNAGTTGF